MSLLDDYSNQAESYDSTRGASPSVLGPLRAALAGAPGPLLADIGGGTGNYALALRRDGWEPTVIDRSAPMLARAAAKGLPTLQADAQSLPLASESFDGALLVSMLHHVQEPEAALSEAVRILRPGGTLAVLVFTREDMARLWCLDYFPSARPWMEETHLPCAGVQRALPGSRRMEVRFEDLVDAPLAALVGHPELLLERSWRGQTSFFERMERDHGQELERGLERLRRDVALGHAPREPGSASLISWRKGAMGQPVDVYQR